MWNSLLFFLFVVKCSCSFGFFGSCIFGEREKRKENMQWKLHSRYVMVNPFMWPKVLITILGMWFFSSIFVENLQKLVVHVGSYHKACSSCKVSCKSNDQHDVITLMLKKTLCCGVHQILLLWLWLLSFAYQAKERCGSYFLWLLCYMCFA